MRAAWLILLCAVAARAVTSAPVEDPLSNPGFVHFYNLEYGPALQYFEQEARAHPDDPNQYNHIAQTILYREMFRNGALESELVSGTNPFLRSARLIISPADKQQFDSCIARALVLSGQAEAKNPNDVQALYAAAVAHGLRANYLFLIEKAWMESLKEATAARKANQTVLELDPQFTDARLVLGLYKYVVASLPFYMRALGFIGGFHGDAEGGIADLELVRRKGVMNRYDAEVLLAVIYRRERQPLKAVPLLLDAAGRFPRNYLLRFELVEMYSDLGNKAEALRVLDQADQLRRAQAPGYRDLSVAKVEYLRGNLLFWYRDLDGALQSLHIATQNAGALPIATAALAWLRTGQVYDLKGNHGQAIRAYDEVGRLAPQSDIASEAKGYIRDRYVRKHS